MRKLALALPTTSLLISTARAAYLVEFSYEALDSQQSGTPRESVMAPTQLPESKLTLVKNGGSLSATPMESVSRLSEIDSEIREQIDELITEFNAREEDGKIIVSLSGDILFDFDKSDIRADAEPVLDQMSELLDAFETSPVIISGHTNSKGEDDYNLALSERRTVSVRDWLSDDGIEQSRMSTEGLGEQNPVAPNTNPDGHDDPAGRQKNRRVEFTICSRNK